MKSIFQKTLPALFIATAVLLAAVEPASAQAVAGGILDSTSNAFKGLQSAWFGALFSDAKDLFSILTGLEIAWLGITWLIARRTFDEVVPSLVKKIIVISFFYTILINASTWVPDIIDSFTKAGSDASGLAGLSPSTIVGYGIDAASNVLGGQYTQGGSGWLSMTLQGIKNAVDPFMWLEMIERVLIAIVLFLAFLYIAIEMMILLIESYLILGAGVLFLGFGASRWTTKYVDGYLNFAVSIGVKLFVIYLIVGGLMTSVVPTINSQLASPGAFNLSGGLSAAAIMIVAAMLAKKIPDHAGTLLGGGPGLTAGAFGGEASKAGSVVAGVAMAGAAVATGGAAAVAGAGVAAASTTTAAAATTAAGTASTAAAGAATGSAAGAGGVAAAPGAAGVPAPSVSPSAAPNSGPAPSPAAPSASGSQQDARTNSGNEPAGGGQTPQGGAAAPKNLSAAAKQAGRGLQQIVQNAGGGSNASVQAGHISTSHGHD